MANWGRAAADDWDRPRFSPRPRSAQARDSEDRWVGSPGTHRETRCATLAGPAQRNCPAGIAHRAVNIRAEYGITKLLAGVNDFHSTISSVGRQVFWVFANCWLGIGEPLDLCIQVGTCCLEYRGDSLGPVGGEGLIILCAMNGVSMATNLDLCPLGYLGYQRLHLGRSCGWKLRTIWSEKDVGCQGSGGFPVLFLNLFYSLHGSGEIPDDDTCTRVPNAHGLRNKLV